MGQLTKKVGGLILGSTNLHAEVFSGKVLKQKLARKQPLVCKCVNVNVAVFFFYTHHQAFQYVSANTDR